MRRKLPPERHVDFGRLCATFDSVDADHSLRIKTLEDVVRADRGEIKPVTVYRNLSRRIDALKQGSSPAL